MANNGSIRNALGWIAGVAGGTWLSLRFARWLTEWVAGLGPIEPVRAVVEEVLEEHRAEDTPMVQAFAEAVEAEEAEEAVGPAPH